MNRKTSLKQLCLITFIIISVVNVANGNKCALQDINALWNFFGKEIVYKTLGLQM